MVSIQVQVQRGSRQRLREEVQEPLAGAAGARAGRGDPHRQSCTQSDVFRDHPRVLHPNRTLRSCWNHEENIEASVLDCWACWKGLKQDDD